MEDYRINITSVSYPPFDGYMTKCCNSSVLFGTNKTRCLICNTEEPEMIKYKPKIISNEKRQKENTNN